MSLILGTVALMVAFAGLWLGSLAMKKATEEVTNFTNFVRRDLGALKKELNGRVSEIERMQIKLQKRLEQSKEVEGTTRQMINEIKVDVIGIKENVAELDSAIPAQFRRRPTASEPRVKN
ncbi:MAG: hypothetical protein HOB37_17975 [Rhodospirillaceae bacterium]|nr:hypothetical protein [Rhodospirillaceae bacterium]